MPWRETAPMKERMRFVTDWERDLYSMVELCERYGVSRKTGYKWLARYERVDDGVWSIYFCHVLLARIDERDYVLHA